MRLRTIFPSLLLASLALWPISDAEAITLTVAALTNNSTTSGAAGNGIAQSAVAVISGGGSAPDIINNVVAGSTRYSFGSAADNGANSGADAITLNSSYNVPFSVSAPGYVVYSVIITTSLRGGLTVVDDYGLGNGTSGIASITNVTGSSNVEGVQAQLGLASAANRTGSSGSDQTDVNIGNTYTISGLSGNQLRTLTFTWSSTSNSPSNSSILDNSDEVGVRFGIGGIQGSNAADDYPGTGARVQANDGHFVSIEVQVTAVPEPSSSALAAFGACGLAMAARRRRKA
jgi:hypothetical protein